MTGLAGVILAGGRARRMGGGDKPLLTLAGRPVLAHIVDALRPQVSALAINAAGNPARFAAWALPVIADPFPGEGPLSGILAALRWANAPVLTAPGDTPFLPKDLAAALLSALTREDAEVAIAARAGALHPVTAVWSPRVMEALEHLLAAPGERSVETFFRTRKGAVVSFDHGPDPFFNINTPGDLAAAETRLTSE